jgi:uncharacterized protein YuzE
MERGIKMIKDFKIKIDPITSVAYISITNSKVSKTENLSESVNADLNLSGQLVGLEVLNVDSFKEISDSVANLGLSKKEIETILSELEAQI